MRDLLQGVRRIVEGGRFFSEPISRRLEMDLSTQRPRLRDPSPVARLTSRQLQVLTLISEGLSTRQIAQRLRITVKAAESHKYRLMNRLQIRDRVQLTRLAIDEGVATVPEPFSESVVSGGLEGPKFSLPRSTPADADDDSIGPMSARERKRND